MPTPARVRVVVVTWQAAHLLPECLDSLVDQRVAGAEVEIVVVDNASTDETGELLATRYPQVRVVELPRNVGFAGGASAGLRGFDGDVVALLNNDATLDPGALQALVAPLLSGGDPRLAATTAKILLASRYVPEPDPAAATLPGWRPALDDEAGAQVLVNSTGNVVLADGSGTDRDWLAVLGTESVEPRVFGFCGGAAAIRQAALDDVGGFDASLFLYYEDTDLSWRLRAGGWHVRHVPSAVARHRHASSSGTTSPLFRYYNTRNSLVVALRHAPWPVVLRGAARQCAGLGRSLVRDGPRSALVRARGRALRDAARALPASLRRRRRLWRDAPVSRRAAMRADDVTAAP